MKGVADEWFPQHAEVSTSLIAHQLFSIFGKEKPVHVKNSHNWGFFFWFCDTFKFSSFLSPKRNYCDHQISCRQVSEPYLYVNCFNVPLVHLTEKFLKIHRFCLRNYNSQVFLNSLHLYGQNKPPITSTDQKRKCHISLISPGPRPQALCTPILKYINDFLTTIDSRICAFFFFALSTHSDFFLRPYLGLTLSYSN